MFSGIKTFLNRRALVLEAGPTFVRMLKSGVSPLDIQQRIETDYADDVGVKKDLMMSLTIAVEELERYHHGH